MAKGDQPKAQNMINTQGPLAQNYLSSQQGQVGRTTGNLSNTYFGGSGGSMSPTNYQDIISKITAGKAANPETLASLAPEFEKYGMKLKPNAQGKATGWIRMPNGQMVDVGQAFSSGDPNKMKWQYLEEQANGGGAGGVLGQNLGDYKNIMGRYENFADTGGYSKEDLSNIRARAVSPTRGIYARGQQELQRNRALQGGYSPNYAAATAKMAREQGQQISDINRSTEADIAQMVHSGKLAGMGGMAGIYGATPGLSDMFGRQVLASQGQGLEAAGLQNQLGLGMIGAQQNNAKIPGNWMQGVNNIGGGFDIAGKVGSAIYPWLE
jgi:hypothetical protein